MGVGLIIFLIFVILFLLFFAIPALIWMAYDIFVSWNDEGGPWDIY